jgi:hypothetical protein
MASKKPSGSSAAASASLAPPVFEGQNCINGVHIVRLRAPKFGNDPKLFETRIVRAMLHDVTGKNGRIWKIVRTDIVAKGKPGAMDGQLVSDSFVPGGLFFYAAVACYNDGSYQSSYGLTPVQIP